MAEALLQLAANDSVIAQEIARLDEKVQEIEPPGLGLQGLVGLNRRLQSVMQEGSEIGVARLNESIEIGLGLVSKREDFIARTISKGRLLGALPDPTPPASDSTKIRFESVIVAIADRLQTGRFIDETRNFGQIAGEIVVQATSSWPRARRARTARSLARRSRHFGRTSGVATASEKSRCSRSVCIAFRSCSRGDCLPDRRLRMRRTPSGGSARIV